MELFPALGARIQAEFAARRDTVPRWYFYAPDAARSLAAALASALPGRHVLCLSDRRTRAAAFAPLGQALAAAGFTVAEHVLADGPDGASPVCDDVTKDALRPLLPAADLYVAVGSGVVNDLTKWLGAENGVPYAVWATAASMNGYTAANVAPAIKGVKSLFRAKAPLAVAADPAVVEGAPFALTSSGLGDVIAKPVSTADWRMNHLLFGEAWSDAVAGIIDQVEPAYVGNPDGIARREPAAVKGLFDALVYSGCAMTLQGSSLPASGGEHLVSHTLDMLAHVDHVPHDLHGRQVGCGTIFAAALYQRVMALDRPVFRAVDVPYDAALWGPIAGAVAAERTKKQAAMEAAARALNEPGRWEAVRAALQPLLRQPAAIKQVLARAGAAHRFSDLGIGRDRFRTALLHGASIRGRFTSLDLAWAAGVLPAAADEITEEFLTR